jgi:hypothetical protein
VIRPQRGAAAQGKQQDGEGDGMQSIHVDHCRSSRVTAVPLGRVLDS